MSVTRNAIFWLVLWLLWTILAYPTCLKDCCLGEGSSDEAVGLVEEDPEEPEGTEEGTETPTARGPIDFEWSVARPNTNDGFDDFSRNILAGQTDNNILEIVGLYFEEETTPDGYENIGLARAGMTRDLLAPNLPDDRINLRSRLVDEGEGVREGFFDAVEFRWLEAEERVAATVEELADRRIIRFPFNSTEKEYDPSVDEYLDKLADRVKETGESVRLVGHTDNVGGEEANMVLSDRRAKVIRDILRNKGVSSDQITTEARGETQPVASNDTEEGRHDNRRVEIFLNKAN